MANCATLRLDPRELSLWEYQAHLWHYHDRNATEEDDPVDPPSEDFVKHRAMVLRQRGIATGSVH